MATAVRNTGTHFRFDGDTQLWNAKVRLAKTSADGEQFLEFVTKVATLLELLAWLASLFDGLAVVEDTTVQGHPVAGIKVEAEGP